MFLHKEITHRQKKRKAGRIVKYDSKKETNEGKRSRKASKRKGRNFVLITVVFPTPRVYLLMYIC